MHQDDVRASLEDLAIRWETPRGRELKALILKDAKESGGSGIARVLKDFIYVNEVPDGRDLRCITLENEDLAGAVFYKSDLSWASLAGCSLQRADFKEAILKRANLSGADLSLAHLEEADCSRTDFSRCSLDGAHFRRTKLNGSVFEGADASRASFDGANLSKANFRGAKLDQANFHGADVSQANFDTGALDHAAAKPAKDRDLCLDMGREEFERKVGLHAITSRTTKRFKGLDAIRQAAALLEAAKAGAGGSGAADKKKGPGGAPVPYFGASVLGTRRLKPGGEEPPLPSAVPAEEPAGAGLAFAPEASSVLDDDAAFRPTVVFPAPVAEPADGARPSDRITRAQRPTQRGMAPVPGSGPARRAGPPGAPGRGAPSGAFRRPLPGPSRPASGSFRRPPPPPAARPPVVAPPPAAPLPVAPFDPSAPAPTDDWGKAIGQLMQFKGAITKIAIELKDHSQVIYKAPEEDAAAGASDTGGYS